MLLLKNNNAVLFVFYRVYPRDVERMERQLSVKTPSSNNLNLCGKVSLQITLPPKLSKARGYTKKERGNIRFFPFAGLHRPVVLYSVPQTYIEDVTVATGIDGANGTVTITAGLNEPVTAQGSVTLKGSDKPVQATLSFNKGRNIRPALTPVSCPVSITT